MGMLGALSRVRPVSSSGLFPLVRRGVVVNVPPRGPLRITGRGLDLKTALEKSSCPRGRCKDQKALQGFLISLKPSPRRGPLTLWLLAKETTTWQTLASLVGMARRLRHPSSSKSVFSRLALLPALGPAPRNIKQKADN